MKTRRILSLVLSLILAIPLSLSLAVPASAADLTYDVTGGRIYFDANTGAITDCDETVTEAVIPEQIYGVTVTAIGNSAFNRCSSLTTVTIPDTVTSIGENAFYLCPALTSVVIPDSVTTIGRFAFGKSSLTGIQLSRNLTEISEYTFYGCGGLTEVTIPDGVTSIGEQAFTLSGLTTITVPDSVTSIGSNAFSSCESLTSADLGSGVSSLGGLAFDHCTSLKSVTLSPALREIPIGAFSYCYALEEVVIPEGVTRIRNGAFSDCSSLRSVTLPSTLQQVDFSVFSNDSSLTDVYYNGTAMDWAAIQMDSALGGELHFAEPVAGFNDVTSFAYYADAVEWAVSSGVTTGTGASTFSPDAAVTRAQAVTFLWRAVGSPEPASASSPFTDVTDPSAYYYKAVLWAAEQGITGGVGNNAFGLDNTLTYDQIFTFLCRAAGDSADGADWSAAAVNWASANGLTDGLSFSAKDECPRCDLVYCLWKQMA